MSTNVEYTGRHLILDLYGAYETTLQNEELLSEVLLDACKAAGATVLHSHFHHFGGDYGVTGVIVLSESHCSIHTWPEYGYASIDIYMCGAADPRAAARHIKNDIYHTKALEYMMYRGTEV